VDLLVTSAGIAGAEHHSEMTFENWRRMLSVNLDGTYLPVMEVKDGMLDRGYGRIVCIASIAGLRARGRMITYSTSKAGVIAFSRSCAEAFGPSIRVNCVAPGLIETEMGATAGAETIQRMADEAFLKRIGQPEEIAETVLFLLSERSSFTTGQTYVADGGRVTLP
jgi:3-oxoacyl-[acyl-carrier protein] reductase